MEAKDKQLSRRNFMKYLALSIGAISTLATPIYSFFIEKDWIEVNHLKLEILQQESKFTGIRIAHISDLHYGFFMSLEQTKKIFEMVNHLQPDIICFTGDIVDREARSFEGLAKMLELLKAPWGKFAVLGNHDGEVSPKMLEQAYSSAGFKLLQNQHVTLTQDGEKLHIAGVDDWITGRPDLKEALEGIPSDQTVILLSHAPDFADKAKKQSHIKLQLSGHSHGGQIRLPLLGHLVTPQYGKKYVQGLYQLSSSPFYVYTSRGVGTSTLPFRVNCRPEITVLELT